ncbi:MAG: hypothetical protein ACKV2Q_10480 [Planctomycetaceae bacterium]
MTDLWLEQAKKLLEDKLKQDVDVSFDRLQELGMINDRGEVTGRLHRWDAYLAITEVKRAAGQPLIEQFRCLKPVFGMPRGSAIEVSRDSMVDYLKAGKKVITSRRDERLKMWKEGCDVHLSANGFVRCDSSDDMADDVGVLPEFQPHTAQ